jgi:hypothetical protein
MTTIVAHALGHLPRDVIRVKPRASLDGGRREAERLDGMFPLARQIVEAGTHGARAARLLRISDEIVLGHFASLTAACQETGFEDGKQYLLERYAALMAVRDPFGRLRDADRLELFRRGLAALAHGGTAR